MLMILLREDSLELELVYNRVLEWEYYGYCRVIDLKL